MAEEDATKAIQDHFAKLAEAMISGDISKSLALMENPPAGVTSGTGYGHIDGDGNISLSPMSAPFGKMR